MKWRGALRAPHTRLDQMTGPNKHRHEQKHIHIWIYMYGCTSPLHVVVCACRIACAIYIYIHNISQRETVRYVTVRCLLSAFALSDNECIHSECTRKPCSETQGRACWAHVMRAACDVAAAADHVAPSTLKNRRTRERLVKTIRRRK